METLHASRSLIHSRLNVLRAAMLQQQLAAWVVPSSDPHLSEYLPERWKGREWLSGFTGSVGTLIVTADFAGLWADSRYWSQAEAELAGTGIALMKIPTGNSMLHLDWLAEHITAGDSVGVDGAVLSRLYLYWGQSRIKQSIRVGRRSVTPFRRDRGAARMHSQFDQQRLIFLDFRIAGGE